MRIIALLSVLLMTGCMSPTELKPLQSGKQLAFDRKKGNCLACHHIAGGQSPGNIGPPLSNLQHRFNNKTDLVNFIEDPTIFNPATSMPPFGRNNILTRHEIKTIANFLWTLPATESIIPLR